MLRKLAYLVLFGNYYLAFCIVALSVETVLKNGGSLASVPYYLFVFFSVVVYYTHAYIGDRIGVPAANARSLWYYRYRRFILTTQVLYTLFIAVSGIYLLFLNATVLHLFSLENWFWLILFPFLAMLYYGAVFPYSFRFRLRNIAWLKPFIIGFVCTGIIVIYPLLYFSLQKGVTFHLTLADAAYFLTNWLYTTAIAIMFDIKDFSADHNYHLKTFVVAKGLRYTIRFILLPLALASLLSFMLFARIKHFTNLQIGVNLIPFCLMLWAATSLRRRKGILFYLIVIDGLLLVKALFGIAAMLLQK